jgi:dipeptidyl aminopeptidase/acylaminoacyl peptidase
MGADGEDPVLLGEADAGHGYRPDWSLDGQQIAYVVRERGNEEADATDHAADYVAGRLVSNIYLADLRERKISPVTHFRGALTETPVWSPDGEYLAFSTTAGGSGMDVWVYETRSQTLKQVTHGAKARYPSWLSNP